MKSTLDISVEVRCGCGNELRVLDVTDFNPGEITVEVRACDNCVSKDLNALNARVSTLEAEVASIRVNQRTQHDKANICSTCNGSCALFTGTTTDARCPSCGGSGKLRHV